GERGPGRHHLRGLDRRGNRGDGPRAHGCARRARPHRLRLLHRRAGGRATPERARGSHRDHQRPSRGARPPRAHPASPIHTHEIGTHMDSEPAATTHEILERLRSLRELDPPTHGGRVLSYVYDPGIPGLDELITGAATSYLPVNGLDPTTFASVAVLERDIVAFARRLTNGDEDVVGSVTSGGTESCLLAVKSAREVWRAAHGETGAPTLVAPTTAHAAFHKGCEYFGLA